MIIYHTAFALGPYTCYDASLSPFNSVRVRIRCRSEQIFQCLISKDTRNRKGYVFKGAPLTLTGAVRRLTSEASAWRPENRQEVLVLLSAALYLGQTLSTGTVPWEDTEHGHVPCLG
jgi:hypothetical protein